MSFGSGGFGGFGSSNNQSSGFGGFGANNNNTSSGGFGTNNTTTSFGSKPFSSGSNMFGGGSSAFGGFGSGTSNNNATSAFGGGNTSGSGLFGQAKPAFGSSTTATGTGNLFGGNTSSGFGGSNTTSNAFGTSTAGGFGTGTSNVTPNNGTASTPFQAIQEKEGPSSNAQVQYQTITFMQPYQNYSLEELRTVDYNQGRRYGSNNGQPGAFGQSTPFGGFGSNNNTSSTFGSNNASTGGVFGNNNTAGSAFGASSTSGAFGSNNTGGGMFGNNNNQAKPAGGLFGSSTPATGGSLFGNNNSSNTGSGFGSTGGAFGSSTGGGGGLFGNTNNNTQAKPAFGGFGNTNTASTPFGAGNANTNTANTGSSLFGGQNTNNTSAFGANNQALGTGGGLFGNSGGAFGQNNQQNTQSSGLFGGGGGGAFGQNNQNNQPKTGGLFGGSTSTPATGGGLFGNNNQQQQQPPTGGLFGQAKPAQNSLFGNTNNAQTGQTGGLFGNSTGAATGTGGGGLFGNSGGQSNQQNTGGGLFAGSNNQSKPSGIFGNSTGATNNASGGLFGGLGQNNQNNNQLGGSLFGGQSQGQQQQPSMNNSLFGASGSSLLQTSMNTNPYGNDALFSGLGTPTQSPGPLATPLSSSQKNRKSAILPQHKLNPSQSTRLLTPQGKRGGYGFTYSTYGSPNGSTQSSPLNGSLFGNGSLSRSLGKSLSASNLRNSMTPDTSILAPGAFSTTNRSFGNGSLKKLNINRSINSRRSLFEDTSPAKRVSFAGPGAENGLSNGTAVNGSSSSSVVLRRDDESASTNGEASHTGPYSPESESAQGNELATVSEDGALTPRTSSSLNAQNGQIVDPKPGEYYSEPSMDRLKAMSKRELESVPNFVVGRDRVGRIEFNEGKPINLSEVPLDKIFGDIVTLETRNATVYGANCSVPKPQLGSPGLNHPSRITLGNSWPRGTRLGKKDQKHLERLKRVNGTTFESYNPETGDWTFRVPHFSSYGLDYDDDEESEEASSPLSPVPETPAQIGSSQMTNTPGNDSLASASQSSPDDTFDFKKGMRKRANVPGQFGDQAAYEEDQEMEETQGESFLGLRSVDSLDGQRDNVDESDSGSVEDQEMADSVSGPVHATERNNDKVSESFKDSVKPKSILKTSQVLRPMGTPSKGPLVFDDDWANTLQRTISPKKQDRQALRESQANVRRERDNDKVMNQPVGGRFTKTTMDRMELMDSLFGTTDKRKDSTATKRAAQGIEFPYAKRPKTSHDLDQLSGADKDFHSCNKPHFSETGIIVYAGKQSDTGDEGIYFHPRESIAGAEKDIRFKALPTFADAVPPTIELQKEHTKMSFREHAPLAKLKVEPELLEFHAIADAVALGTPASEHEQQAWKLLSLLFDDIPPSGVDSSDFAKSRDRYLKEQLSDFWKSLVFEDAQKHAEEPSISPEEKAIAYLSCNSVADACHALVEGHDLRLATMVAQIGGDDTARQDMTSQLDEWRRMDVLSEIDEAVRTLYELIAGNCAQSEGKTNGGRENKTPSFIISSRFNLDWRRAFGLRLWYGTKVDEPIELAVAQFADALRFGNEDVKPVPWFIEQGKDMGWNDPKKENREDLLWGILKLYASSKMDVAANVEDVLAPENVSGHPLNARLSFQLFNIFKSRAEDIDESPERVVGMPIVREEGSRHSSFLSPGSSTADLDDEGTNALVELGDKLALTYAASLYTLEHWTTAAWVYGHVSHGATREHFIRSLLAQFSHTFSLTESDATYTHLTEDLDIPHTWIHAAAALQAKVEGDTLRQAMHLIKANELKEAHEVLCRSVGPDSVISRDYDALRELLGGFMPTPPSSPTSNPSHSRGRKEPVQGWNFGGQIYFDYIELLDLTGQRSTYRVDKELNERIRDLLVKISRAMETVAVRWKQMELQERVALTEIAGTVAAGLAKLQSSDRSRILKLPLTEDLWLKHSIELSTGYYRNVIAAGR
ncbi:hypothetical protein CC80DRAFT_496441 [Byssothecium circinans]|uniref:Peptidase S59 domain-containing protein n=1 Tax=Byssothecium circinans TaxID=147558 RepID=A0A6A5TGN0_9PLEO|nr:hypothetical protein CC80DRAFT_496441 [Byssothecium circinans]